MNEFKRENTQRGAAWVGGDKALRKRGCYSPETEFRSGTRRLAVNCTCRALSPGGHRQGEAQGLVAIAALLRLRRGVAIIDPKSENALVCSNARRRFGPVHVLSPFKNYTDDLGHLREVQRIDDGILDTGSLSFHSGCDRLAARSSGRKSSFRTVRAFSFRALSRRRNAMRRRASKILWK